MGRHSLSYIAAQQGHSAGPTPAGAAKYVGGVGAVALSLWAGAAIAGSGLANAEGSPADKGPDAAGAVKSALHSITEGLRHGLGDDSATDGASGLKLPKPGLFKLPKSSDDGDNALTGPLSGVAGRVSHQTGDSEPAAKANSQRSVQPGAGLSQAAPIVADTVDALRGVAKPLSVTPFGTADPIGSASPAVSLTRFAPAIAPAASVGPASVATVPSAFLTALGVNPLSNPGGSPVVPSAANVLGALQLMRRETDQRSIAPASSVSSNALLFHPTPVVPPVIIDHRGTPGYPSPSLAPDSPSADDPPAYVAGVGNVGKYMLESNGSVSDYGGQPYQGKTLDEPVNVIIIDPTSKSAAESQLKVNKDLTLAGFPAQPVHSGGFQGTINGKTYSQKPALPLTAYSDNSFLVQNDHGRLFGPAPIPATEGTGYVYTGAFSTETPTIYNGLPAHAYVSSNAARDALVARLIATGQVSKVEYVPLNNAYNDGTTTTGDHDGYAVVITLK
jgi:hypothetical protein